MRPQKTEQVPVEELRLDHLNPRLVGGVDGASDEAIIARLYRAAELSELLQSISANGYLDIEPLVVITAPEGNALIVLEGTDGSPRCVYCASRIWSAGSRRRNGSA